MPRTLPKRYMLVNNKYTTLDVEKYYQCGNKPFMVTRTNNLEFLRKRARLTRAEVAHRLGTTTTTIYRKERAGRGLKDHEVPKYAKAYECKESEIIGEQAPSEIEITHFIGTNGELFLLPEKERRTVPSPVTFKIRVEAAIVKDNYMFPVFQENQVIFYTKEGIGRIPSITGWQINYNAPTAIDRYAEFLGKHCLVELSSGEILLRQFKLGSERGRYTLHSYNAPDMENVEIRTAYKIIFIKVDFTDDL